jgi:dihydrolipoamide dehydrogenase
MPTASPASFDLAIIGCGPGGFAGAMRAIDAGRHVCIIESDQIGGAGVMWGALASKTMWELAKDFKVASKIDRGYRASGLVVDYSELRQTVLHAVKEKQYQMLSQIETYSARCWKGPGSLTLKQGSARFTGPHTLDIRCEDGTAEAVQADHILVATGSRPRPFSGFSVDQERIIDSDGILNLKSFPRRMMIIGAGIIGCEYATIFSSFGQTKVYLVDYQDRIIPYEDEDISQFVSENLKKNQVEIFHSAILKEVKPQGSHLQVVLGFNGGRAQVIEVDALLLSIGRQPALSGLNLAAAGIAPDAGGFLTADDNCRVADGIYAAGDVLRHPALVNLAEMESRHAVKHMFGMPTRPLNYRNMSTVMFFNPAVAAVGMNEKTCQEKRIPYRVATYANSLLSRAIAMRALNGFVKIIVSADDEQRILGMRAAGPQVSTSIMSIALLMDQGKGIRDVLKSLYPHPTMTEGIQECLRLLTGKSVYKPTAFPDLLSIRTWHPADSPEKGE